jgi:hypothetical protein
MRDNIIPFRRRANQKADRAFWIGPDPFELLAMTLATTALMGDAWLQSLALFPEENPVLAPGASTENPKESTS